MRTVDINLSKSRKGRSIVKAAKVVDFCSVSRGLLAKLIAGEIQNIKPFFLVALIEFLQFLVLRSEAAAGRCIDNQQNLSFIITHFLQTSVLFLDFDIINVCHVLLLCLLPILSQFYVKERKQDLIVPVSALMLFFQSKRWYNEN